ncbi:MAG: phosphoglycerate kinase [Deltaproteobacteria bacterium]|uniref:Phosphoglycerate kinase n=1 Tax=Candidatus Zymogenus saltonus TaxID=2844893 RepID=A0A9D8PND3_9DELT|nr:phosphoglycerate kinase [Candidatus Zymogenus saltonus]
MNRKFDGVDAAVPKIQDADLDDKVVLVRVDHNVVKRGEITDPFRIDSTIGTLYNIVERGGRLILMTHVGRPKNKKTGEISVDPDTSVKPIVEYLERKLHTDFIVPEFKSTPQGIAGIDTSINLHIRDLRNHKIGGIYLPNTRWFSGEEAGGQEQEAFAIMLAGLADVFVNDAFGSWQPHASTYDIAKLLPSYAGYLLQQEISNLTHVLNPKRPFLAVVAGAKFDTKIDPLRKLYDEVDCLILGGVIYNTYLAAKYGIKISGVTEDEMEMARELVEKDEKGKKILELPVIVESDTLEGKMEGKYRSVEIEKLKKGDSLNYILDIDPVSFEEKGVMDAILGAGTIFVNAVMGFTPHFTEGSKALDNAIDKNRDAKKMYGGGDTLKEFKDLLPGLYLAVLDDSRYYFFTGGGAVLKAIKEGDPYGLPPVKALMKK